MTQFLSQSNRVRTAFNDIFVAVRLRHSVLLMWVKRVYKRHGVIHIGNCVIYYTGTFPVGDTSSGTLIAVCVCVSLSADISLYCAKNDSTDYPEILWVCWV